ncbi:hypothetical protein EC957_000470 [Mortierella hygrophila]|uniref:Uncharacterized protein n=1 Tax=Mortierella hygrophila TaxID=979708 RepID=A0A9P6F620_9FUNG|nr:hypothetical protein EC957_000470 [Mortierella hygrophila]
MDGEVFERVLISDKVPRAPIVLDDIQRAALVADLFSWHWSQRPHKPLCRDYISEDEVTLKYAADGLQEHGASVDLSNKAWFSLFLCKLGAFNRSWGNAPIC